MCCVSERKVIFRHYVTPTKRHDIKMDYEQFENLHDILSTEGWKRCPLGNGLWIHFYAPEIAIHDVVSKTYFQFFRVSWEKYIKRVHYRIYSFFHHVSCRSDDYQYYATNSRKHKAQHRRIAQTISKTNETLSWSPRDVNNEDEQWSKCANVSVRQNSSSRCNFSFREQLNVLRATSAFENEREDGELSNDETDFSQYGSECSVE